MSTPEEYAQSMLLGVLLVLACVVGAVWVFY